MASSASLERRREGRPARTGGTRPAARGRAALAALPFLSPWVAGVACLVAIPLGLSLYWSFTNYNLLTPPHWVGLSNYRSLFHDPVFWLSVRNTIYITVIGSIAGIVMGLGSALLLNKPGKAVTFYRSAIFIPAVVPVVSMVIAWVWILNPDYGLLNGVLHLLHLPTFGWLNDPSTAKISLLIIILWGSVGQIMIVFLAALKAIPQDYYDAAAVDGASAWSQFRRLTLPLLSPVLLYNAVIALVFYTQMFEQAFVASPLDLGAPVNSTLFYSLYLYQNAFTYLSMGRAAAMACLLLVFSLLAVAGFFALQSSLRPLGRLAMAATTEARESRTDPAMPHARLKEAAPVAGPRHPAPGVPHHRGDLPGPAVLDAVRIAEVQCGYLSLPAQPLAGSSAVVELSQGADVHTLLALSREQHHRRGLHGGRHAGVLRTGGVRILGHEVARTRTDVRGVTGPDHAAVPRRDDPALRHLPAPGLDRHADALAGASVGGPVRDAVLLCRAGDLPAAPVLPRRCRYRSSRRPGWTAQATGRSCARS